MNTYRIDVQRAPKGREVVLMHTVQVQHTGVCRQTWVDIKTFEDQKKAERLLKILRGEIKVL